MDAATCRSQLERLLADETALLAGLEQQLQNEHALLTNNDVDALELAADARQRSVVALLRVDDERRQLCRLLGRASDAQGLMDLLRWCDSGGSLAGAHAACAQAAQRCREQNDRNGMLVTARLTRVSGMLDALAGPATRTYDTRPGARPAGTMPAGRMLSTSA